MSLSHLLLLLSVKACLLVDCGRIDSIIGRSDSISGRIDSSGGQIGGIVFNDEEDAILWRRDGRCGPEHLLPDGRPGEEFDWIIVDDFENLFEIPLQKQVFDFCNSIDILKIFFKIFLKKISH